MSRTLLQPNYCSCTVHQARNLPDKGKNGGINAFCTISMGKDKFVTAVREKTRTPEWQEQCDMPIVDDAAIKLTVYHNNKNALSKGDFVGRAYVSLRDLQDYDRVHRNWYKLTNKDGKNDKERGEIDVSLQFYSKNNTTGSVLDLATKKKHISLKEIKQSLGGKLKSASKQRRQDSYGSDNQLAEQRRRLGGGDDSTFNVRDFLDDSASETQSFNGSHISINTMPNVESRKKTMSLNRQEFDMPRAPSSGLGSTLSTETPHSSRRSITSDYDTSSILDSASMYGGDEPSTISSPARSQIPQQSYREVYVGDELPPRSNSTRKKTKESSPLPPLPTIPTTNIQNNSPPLSSTDPSRSFSITGDDIEAAFDEINDYKTSTNEPSWNKSKEYEMSSPDSLFGLSTIKEANDTDETVFGANLSTYNQNEEELDDIDFNDCFNRYQPEKQKNETKPSEEKRNKKSAPSPPTTIQQSQKIQTAKSTRHLKEHKRTAPDNDINTSSITIPTPKIDTTPTPVTISARKQNEMTPDHLDDSNDSIDEDVDELLGKLERMSSIRSSVKRKIQPKEDLMQQSLTELDPPTNNKFFNNYTQNQNNRTDRNGMTTLPDIVGQPSVTNSSQRNTPSTNSGNRKTKDQGLCVLGYENVQNAPVHPKIRQELDYLDREELLHVIAYQSDLLKRRDTRLKDLENYTDTLLVKILEQCPAILQVGTSSSTSLYR